MVNLKELASKIDRSQTLDWRDAESLLSCAAVAETMAFDVDSLVDGKDDELAELLSPVVEFLRKLAGIPDGTAKTDG